MFTSKNVIIGIIGAVLISALIFIIWAIGVSNHEVKIRNGFAQKETERKAFYQKSYMKISGVAKVATVNDSSFQKVVNAQMAGQKDAPGLFMKWITQSNPAATFTEVADLYKELARVIESEREGFFNQEKVMQDYKLQHDNLIKTWPAKLIVGSRPPLIYIPVSSDRTDDVFKTMKDNNTDPFK